MTTPQQVSPAQVMAQSIVSVMSVSIVASVMNIAMASMGGASVYNKIPSKLKITDKALADLKLTFGSSIVDKAANVVGSDNMLLLAQEIERLTIEDMNTKYGVEFTQSALSAAPPGDFQSALIIAQTLASRGYGKDHPQAPAPAMAQAVGVAKKRKHFKAQPMKDTRTGKIYKSKAQAGMAVAAEYNLSSTDTYVWFAVLKQDPNRFVPASLAEIAKLPKG